MGNSYMDFKSKEKIAIIDANNFYCSCERLFNPALEKKPTVVLSNNDGCIIARSQEVKNMGIKMGQTLFSLEEDKKIQLKKFSSNYALYGDISDRIFHILKRLVPRVEIYSIDEAFFDLSYVSEDNILLETKKIKETIQRLTGIPVSIGVAPNKTLAKLCNRISKIDTSFNGLCSYWDLDKSIIHNFEVDEIWGIGEKSKERLMKSGVSTIGDLLSLQSIQVKNIIKTPGLRTWLELHEFICYPLTTIFKKPQTITCSRSFGIPQSDLDQIKNAFYNFMIICHKKLKKEGLGVNSITIFASTNRFNDDYLFWKKKISLQEQTNDFSNIWNQVFPHLQEIPLRNFFKCGVAFYDIIEESTVQNRIFVDFFKKANEPKVEKQSWITRRLFLSPEYTTKWTDLQSVY